MFDYKYKIELNNGSTEHLFGEGYFGDKSTFWNAHQTTLNELYDTVVQSGFPIKITDLTEHHITTIQRFSEFLEWLDLNQPFNTENKNSKVDELFIELHEKCKAVNHYEFEYYMEVWGVMWYPTFIDIKGKEQTLTMTDITQADLDALVEKKRIELVKEYTSEELDDEMSKYKYRIVNASS